MVSNRIAAASVLLSLLLVTCSAALQSVSVSIGTSARIAYPGTAYVDFENNECFRWGIDGNGTGYMLYGTEYAGTTPYWSGLSYPASLYPEALIFENDSSIVHSGLQSARVSVVDTSNDTARRLEILHDWDPHSAYLWNVAWYYFPSSLAPVDAFVAFHRMIYERMWDQNKAVYYQYFQISLSLLTDARSATLGQQIFVLSLGKGDIDNKNDGIGEIWPYLGADLYSNFDSNQAVPSSWLTKKPGFQVSFDRWFKVATLIYRNMTNFNNGYIKVWIDGSLIWDVQGTRTIGIDPYVLEKIDPLPPEPQGYLCSGFGLYTGISSRPKTIFVDDFIISNSSQVWLAS